AMFYPHQRPVVEMHNEIAGRRDIAEAVTREPDSKSDNDAEGPEKLVADRHCHAPADPPMRLVRDFHCHFHPRMDCANHLSLANAVEGDVRRSSRELRTQVELIAFPGRMDVMGHRVVIHESECLPLPDGDALG